MLDTGMVFFATVAVIGTLLAFREPRYWYLVAVAVGAGALQKAPVALLMVAAILILLPLTSKYHEIKLSHVVANKHFKIALLIAAVMLLVWPVLQMAQYGWKPLRQAYVGQMLERFNPFGQVGRSKDWRALFFSEEAIVWVAGLVSVAVIPFVFRRFETFVPALITVGFILLMSLATGYVSDRYALLILPFLAASLAALAAWLLPGIVALVLAVAVCLAAAGPFKTADALDVMEKGQERYKPLLEKLRSSLLPEENLIVCSWLTDPTKRRVPIFDAALSYYGSNGHRIYSLKRPDALAVEQRFKRNVRPPYRGLCTAAQFNQLKPWLIDHEVLEESEGHVLWAAKTVRISD
jgi:hypothetical protein